MKSKVLLGTIVAVIIVALAGGGAYYWLMMPQTIDLGDGTKLILLGVTYGKKHSAKKFKVNGKKVNATLNSPVDSLCLWVQQKHEANQWPNYQIFAYDPAGTGCASDFTRTYGNMNGMRGNEVMGICFEAFPRRSSTIEFHVQGWNFRNGRQDFSTGRFTIHNPALHGSFDKWTPQTLPVSASDDDLQVTLDRCEMTESQNNMWGAQDLKADDPRKKSVLTAFHIEQAGVAVTNWQPIEIETSDATGNLARTRGRMNRVEDGDQVMTYQWGLWPNEPAWKLRVEMSRSSGYHNDEIGSCSGLPLKDGDVNDTWNPNRRGKPATEIAIGETKVQFYPVVHLSGSQRNMYGGGMDGLLLIRLDQPLKDSRLNIITITDDQNKSIDFMNWGGGGNEYRFSLKNLGDAKSLNITLAIHRSRYVEYTVKPVAKK